MIMRQNEHYNINNETQHPQEEHEIEIIGIQLNRGGPINYLLSKGLKLKKDDCCIIRHKGEEKIALVVQVNEYHHGTPFIDQDSQVLRLAIPEEKRIYLKIRDKEKEACKFCSERIAYLTLPMKLIWMEFLEKGKKAVFYFRAEERIDFRKLVKDLARKFRVRIELKQIGVRDEAKLLCGYGLCGRPLCCSQFLKNFEPVSIKMAKAQNLTLNPAKISGLCGRLMCCLAFEHNNDEENKTE
jgi:cell fate regulator YaaT (PSP1 superfamily)